MLDSYNTVLGSFYGLFGRDHSQSRVSPYWVVWYQESFHLFVFKFLILSLCSSYLFSSIIIIPMCFGNKKKREKNMKDFSLQKAIIITVQAASVTMI